jgi:hypothetical protein
MIFPDVSGITRKVRNFGSGLKIAPIKTTIARGLHGSRPILRVGMGVGYRDSGKTDVCGISPVFGLWGFSPGYRAVGDYISLSRNSHSSTLSPTSHPSLSVCIGIT